MQCCGSGSDVSVIKIASWIRIRISYSELRIRISILTTVFIEDLKHFFKSLVPVLVYNI
jgi:hypothetical protein